jgi:hypothetical protein
MKISVLILLWAFPTVLVAIPAGYVEWPVTAGGNGNLYKHFSVSTSGNNAKVLAAAEVVCGINGHLPFIESSAENNYVFAQSGGGDFLGASRTASTYWEWFDGSSITTFYWNGAEPCCDSSPAYCLQYAGLTTAGGWNDLPCESAYREYTVEVDLPPPEAVEVGSCQTGITDTYDFSTCEYPIRDPILDCEDDKTCIEGVLASSSLTEAEKDDIRTCWTRTYGQKPAGGCVYGTWSTAYKECICVVAAGGNGYCKDSYGKCSSYKTPINDFLGPRYYPCPESLPNSNQCRELESLAICNSVEVPVCHETSGYYETKCLTLSEAQNHRITHPNDNCGCCSLSQENPRPTSLKAKCAKHYA